MAADRTHPPASAAARLHRRHLLARTGTAAVALLGAASPVARAADAKDTAAAAATTTSAELTAQTTEGPYFLDGMPLRADITEGLPGVPLQVVLRVVDARSQPLPGCRVDVWQCDATGLYSGFDDQGDDRKVGTAGRTFLRGAVLTGTDGVASFRTLYPGWYAGRTTHIHFKVRVGQRAVLTSQFFLPDSLSEFLYTSMPTYQRALLRGVLNSTDGIALRAGRTVLGAVREEADRYVASLDVVVDPAANPVVHRPPRPGEGPPPPGQRGPGGPPPGFGGQPPLPVPEGAARIQALVPGPRPAR